MPFFQSMGVRFGVQNILENCGVDKETAGWVAAGASLVTGIATADMHGHLAGEAASHAVSHATSHSASHAVSHATSHAVSHGASESANHASNHALNETTNQVANNNVTEISYEPLGNESQTFNYRQQDDVIDPQPGDHLKVHQKGVGCTLKPDDGCPSATIDYSSGYTNEKMVKVGDQELPIDFTKSNGDYIDHACGTRNNDVYTDPNNRESILSYRVEHANSNIKVTNHTEHVEKYIARKDYSGNQIIEV